MKHLFLLLLSCFIPLSAHAQTELKGLVLDGMSGEPVPMATIVVTGTQYGTACDVNGRFTLLLRPEHHMLRISAIGYTSLVIHIDQTLRDKGELVARLEPSVLNIDEVVVSTSAAQVNDPSASIHNQNATEDLLGRLPGASFIQRANFAWEPVIRGMNGGQVGLVIDGMKVVGACIDRMDPTSAYVEVENLERLELTKGGFDLNNGSQIGGSINLMTEKPTFDEAFYLSSEVGFESSSSLRRGRVVGGMAKGKTSVRGSFSYRHADDFTPGGSASIAHSGYEKNNYKIDVSRKLNHAHLLTASALVDNAWGIGYPVLLMDATLAKAKIYSLTHTWTSHNAETAFSGLETRLYYNTVNHWMDDFKRDVAERRVMRGMYMPMFGRTKTSGALSKANFRFDSKRLGLTLDLYQTESFGDMWMFSIFDNIQDMYLLNLGDVLVQNAAVSADFSSPLSSKMIGRVNARWDFSTRDVGREEARSILEGRWNTIDLQRTYSFGNVSATVEYAANPITKLRLSMAHVSRLPTHVENYGHYVYNYVDGYFYTGNPNLKPERSNQVELGLERWTSWYGVTATVFGNYIQDYIVGLSDSGLSSSTGDTYRFRVYQNAKAAVLSGFEVSGVAEIMPRVSLASTLAYTRGYNRDVDEPMYLIPPLSAMVSARYDGVRFWTELETRMAMPQNRVARIVAEEDGTDGWFVVNARGSWVVRENASIKLGIENMFDTLYHEHLSFGNLPSEGRNVYVSLSYAL